MSKKSTKQIEVDTVFKPNEEGISEWIVRDILNNNPILKWGNNGIGRHGIYFGDNRYIWEKQGKDKIKALRTTGFSDKHLYGAQRPIHNEIDKFYKSQCCVVCGSSSDLVTDHKNDLYNDTRVLDRKTQKKEDFQCLCNHCNLQKRQVSKYTKEQGKRYGATNILSFACYGIDFISGDESFDPNDVNAMVGTYWYDPVEFVKVALEQAVALRVKEATEVIKKNIV
jgi:hypothetical protein